MPIYATLVPKTGNPDLQISIIKDLTKTMNEWQKYTDSPLYTSSDAFGADLIYLNPNTTKFSDACGASCIILLAVSNSAASDSHYTLTVTRDIQELAENH